MFQAFIIPFALCSSSNPIGHSASPTRLGPNRRIPEHGGEHSDLLEEVSKAVEMWQIRTNSPSNWLPSNSIVRRCEVARDLHLNTLITKAGGHRYVQHMLNLDPPSTAVKSYQEQEVREMACLLSTACQANGFPPPEERFPTRHQIRQLSPTLANRIAAFPGRGGYGKLAEYIKSSSSTSTGDFFYSSEEQHTLGTWGIWTSTDLILKELRQHQSHPRIMPRLCSLPSSIACAIQRKGGAAQFAQQTNLILEKDMLKMIRFASVVRWLDQMVQTSNPNDCPYIDLVRLQMENPPQFPSSREVHKWGMETNLARCGGRRYLALRLGFSPNCGINGLRMEPFSVHFAADILGFAISEVLVSMDGNLAMPSINFLVQNGKFNLAEATELLGGEAAVGRRIGLVPDMSKSDECESVIL
ncbi:unnamed protein product [Agarophyton chilense]